MELQENHLRELADVRETIINLESKIKETEHQLHDTSLELMKTKDIILQEQDKSRSLEDRLFIEKEERKRALEDTMHVQEELLNQTRRDADNKLALLDNKLKIAEQIRNKLEEDIDRQKAELLAERLASQQRIRETEVSIREEEVYIF